MLQYANILTQKDKEVRDPVSGHSFPMSMNDMIAEKNARQSQKRDSELASMLTSILK